MAYRVKIGARLDKDIRRLLNAQAGRAIGHLSGVIQDGTSSVHATRKCLKRCRSILRLVKPGLSGKKFRSHDRAFRDIARLLSHDRDSEVIIETITMLSADAAGEDKAAFALALEELNGLRQTSPDAAGHDANTASAIAKLKACEPEINGLRIRKARIALLAQGYAATYAEGRRALKAAYRINDDEAFHTFRKALQHHWRHCQLLAPAWPDLMNVRISAARDLSQTIGIDHDLSLVVAHFGKSGASKLAAPVRKRICAAAIAEQVRLRIEAKPLADRLYAAKPREMERMILALWPAAIRLAKRRQPAPADYPVAEVVPLKAGPRG